jgi:iron complex transport system ATP-binding protein
MTLLTVEQLSIGYARRVIASEISFSLAAGQSIAILGPNGSGKTTLFRTILGAIVPRGGRVLLSGKSIASLTVPEIARQIAYVPQNASGFFNFSVREVVEMARAPHLSWFAQPGPADREIAEQSLYQVGMIDFAHREFSELSGGERQLVMIARALAGQAKCLLLDEPTASLDFGNRLLVLDTLVQLKQRGMAIMFTTHDPDHARHVCGDATDQTLTIARNGQVKVGATADALQIPALAALYGIDESVFQRIANQI